jgi:dolichol-phosphate mannosyltransferase
VSKDDTLDVVKRAAQQDPRIKPVWAPENRCVVDAYFRGYREGLDAGCDYILEMDGGLSHLPEEIPRFQAAMAEGYEFIAGSRFIKGGSHTGSVYRWMVSRGGSWLVNRLLGGRFVDMTSGYQCFCRDAMQEVLETGVRSRAHFFQTEIKLMMQHRRCTEVPITYHNQVAKVGRKNIVEALRNLWQLFLLPHSRKPSTDAELESIKVDFNHHHDSETDSVHDQPESTPKAA